jgi:GNAT superfamily N-acetyltransferase
VASIVYQILDRDEIHQIRPLWDELRIFTRDMTSHFAAYYEQLDFEERIQKFFQPGIQVRIDVAVADPGGRIVGYAIASIDRQGAGELDSFFVHESFRQLGIGKNLLERSVGWMKSRGSTGIRIMTAFENREALALYERLGFFPHLIELNNK